MVDLDTCAARTELRIAHGVLVVVHGARGEVGVLQELDGRVRRAFGGPRGDRVPEFTAPRIGVGVVMDQQIGTVEHVAQRRPVGHVLELDREPTIVTLASEDTVNSDPGTAFPVGGVSRPLLSGSR